MSEDESTRSFELEEMSRERDHAGNNADLKNKIKICESEASESL